MKTTIVCFAISALLLGCSPSKQKIGDQVLEQVEAFRRTNGRLPANLTEIGIKETEEGPIYYQQKTTSTYTLWYGTTLGESVTYDSEIRKWR
jgi:hypothetical protein